MSNVKEIAQRIAAEAAACKVRFPKIWDDSKIVQACGTTLVRMVLDTRVRCNTDRKFCSFCAKQRPVMMRKPLWMT